MGVTSSGIRYPEPSAAVSAGAQNMKDLATDVDPRARGQLARTAQPGTQDVASNANIMTTTVTLPGTGNRRIRVHVNLQALAVTAAVGAASAVIYGGGVASTRILVGQVALSETVIRNGWGDFLAPAGVFTAYLNVVASSGALRVAAAQTFLSIEDLGINF